MATITQITSSTITATVLPNTSYTLYTSTSSNSGYAPSGVVFTTPPDAISYSITYSLLSGTYASLPLTSSGVPTSGTQYIDQQHVPNPRLASIINVNTPAATSFSIAVSSSSNFYNLTVSTLTGCVLVGPDPALTGTYFVLRNNSGVYLSLTFSTTTGATLTGITTPLVIPTLTSAIIVWNGTGYTMF